MKETLGRSRRRKADLTFRYATPADNEALRAFAMSQPTRSRGVTVTPDIGPDPVGAVDFFDRGRVTIAECEGAIVGSVISFRQDVPAGGEARDGLHFASAQVARAHLLDNVAAAMAGWTARRRLFDRERVDAVLWTAEAGSAMSRSYEWRVGAGNRWPLQLEVVLLRPPSTTGDSKRSCPAPPTSRVASPDDVGLLCSLLDEHHAGWLFAYPMDPERLVAALARTPDRYSWSSISVSADERAMVGVVEPRGHRLVRGPDIERIERTASIAHLAFRDGAEESATQLIAEVLGRLPEDVTLARQLDRRCRESAVLEPFVVDRSRLELWAIGLDVSDSALGVCL